MKNKTGRFKNKHRKCQKVNVIGTSRYQINQSFILLTASLLLSIECLKNRGKKNNKNESRQKNMRSGWALKLQIKLEMYRPMDACKRFMQLPYSLCIESNNNYVTNRGRGAKSVPRGAFGGASYLSEAAFGDLTSVSDILGTERI